MSEELVRTLPCEPSKKKTIYWDTKLVGFGVLYEFGIVLPEGDTALLKTLPDAMCDAKTRLPVMLMDSLDEQLVRVRQLQAEIGLIERRLSQQMREIPACKAVAEIPGIGLLTATAVVASMGTPTAFKDAREFAARIGLVPRQTGTGGRVRQLGISKRGDAYLRTLLMHGSSRHDQIQDGPTWPWLTALLQSRPYSVGCRRGCEQAGTNDLGGSGTRSSLAPRGVADRALTTKRTKQPV